MATHNNAIFKKSKLCSNKSIVEKLEMQFTKCDKNNKLRKQIACDGCLRSAIFYLHELNALMNVKKICSAICNRFNQQTQIERICENLKMLHIKL